ncbi:MAG: oxidoreductase C-terminal domain-containing protein, partial [Cryobacterium sp.]
ASHWPSRLASEQAGARLQFAGRVHGGEEMTVEAGSVDTGDLLAVYRRGGRPVAVLGIDQPVLVKEWQGRLDGADPESRRVGAAPADVAVPVALLRDASGPV